MKLSPKRRQGIEFHVKNDDYFGTLATVLNLYRQMLGNSTQERNIASGLENMVDDLLHLHNSYEIRPKKGRK